MNTPFDIMRLCVLVVILIVIEIVIFEIIQIFINSRHKPYVKFRNEYYAVVYIFQLSRSRKGGYTEYSFTKKDGKWKYIINKDNIWSAIMLMTVLLCGILVSFCMNGLPPYFIGILLLAVLFCTVGLVIVYFPLKAYLILNENE